MSTPLDELEQALREFFGDQAAELDQRAQEASGVNPVEAVERALDGER